MEIKLKSDLRLFDTKKNRKIIGCNKKKYTKLLLPLCFFCEKLINYAIIDLNPIEKRKCHTGMFYN